MDHALTIISLVIALAAVIVGPLVSMRVAREQIRASVVSANRQVWINNLRDAVSEFTAKAMMARVFSAKNYADSASLPRIEETVRLAHRIELLINPKEQDHKDLVAQVLQMTNTLNQKNPDNREFDADACQDRILTLTQAILKREWERVKRGD